jgi:hypothetical protein
VYCDLFSEDFWESAPKAKGEATEAMINTTKDRHRFEDMFISSLLFERLEGAVRNFDTLVRKPDPGNRTSGFDERDL